MSHAPSLHLRALRAWWRVSRGMTLGVRIVATDDAGRVCLVRHTYTKGLFLPGGGVERDQTIFEAAIDELHDETGLLAAQADLDLFGLYLNPSFRGDHVALVRAHAWSQVGAPNPREIREVVWARPDALPADARPTTVRRLAEVLNGAPRSAHWD